jgi:hypothetical protein
LPTEYFLEELGHVINVGKFMQSPPLTNGKYKSFDERIQLIIQDLIEGYHISINQALVSEELLEK